MQKGGLIARTFDQAIVAALVALVVFLLVPETFSALGWPALLLIAGGFLLPGVLESGLKKSAHTLHVISILFALAGLALHAMLDGAGLAGSGLHNSGNLALAIVLHRLGVGLVVWLIVQPAFGRMTAISVLLMIALATVLGYLLSEKLLPLAGQNSVMLIQALIIGTIVHSLVYREHVNRH
jgi:hypothetical protein